MVNSSEGEEILIEIQVCVDELMVNDQCMIDTFQTLWPFDVACKNEGIYLCL